MSTNYWKRHYCKDSQYLRVSSLVLMGFVIKHAAKVNPLVPDAHYSECQDKPFPLQIQRLEEVNLK